MERTLFGAAKEGQPAGKQPGEASLWEQGTRAASRNGLGDPQEISRDLPELSSQQDTGNAVGHRGVLALTGLFSGFRGALG